MFKHILVAVDGSPPADRGLRSAIDLAVDQHATLHIVHVVDDTSIMVGLGASELPTTYMGTMFAALRDSGRRILTEAASLATERGVAALPVLVETLGRPVAHTILQQSRKRKADLIVLGTHGRRGIRRLLLGSDAETVLRESRVPVLLVRADESAKSGSRAHPHRAAAGRAPVRTARGIAHPRS